MLLWTVQKAQVPLDDYELEKVLFRLDAGKEGKISYQYGLQIFTLLTYFVIRTCRLARCRYIVYCFCVWCVCVCLFVWLRILPLRIKLAASYFVRRFIGVQGRESPILWTLLPQKPKMGRIGVARALSRSVDREATFVEYRAACGRYRSVLGMCGYNVSPTDVSSCYCVYCT